MSSVHTRHGQVRLHYHLAKSSHGSPLERVCMHVLAIARSGIIRIMVVDPVHHSSMERIAMQDVV